MGNFDFMDGRSESIPKQGNELRRCGDVFWKGRPSLVPGFLVKMGSKSRETNLEDSTLTRSGKSSTNVTSEASLEDTHVSERLYQLAETIGTSRD